MEDENSLAGVLLVSDGRANGADPAEAAQLALAKSAPLWTWTLGGPTPKHDVWIETASTEALAFSGAKVDLNATLREAGYPNQSFKVELLKDDKVISSQEILPDTNGIGRVAMTVTAPDEGEERYVFRTPPEPEQADTATRSRVIAPVNSPDFIGE